MQYGQLAYEFGNKIPLKICKSSNGFYIGTLDEGLPFTRESVEYWKTKEEAEQALASNNWTQRESL